VNDGTGSDIDTATSSTQLSANWSPSSDPESGIARYWYAVGTSPGATNTVNWTSAGATTAVTVTGLSLVNNQKYYFTVKAENGVGLMSAPVSSDGVTYIALHILSQSPAAGTISARRNRA